MLFFKCLAITSVLLSGLFYEVNVCGQQPVCPCSDSSLCQLVKIPPRKEVFVFRTESNDNWKKYDWSVITTIADFGVFDTDLLCYAHAHGVRYVLTADYEANYLANVTARTLWVKNELTKAVNQFKDGVNIDFESILTEKQAPYLVSLVNETSLAFKAVNPYAQITFDTGFAPGCTWDRCYDYKQLSEVCDFLVLMDYDLNGDFFALANDPFPSLVLGVESFIADLIPASKLVVAFPWYGYDWPCTHLLQDSICSFIGVDMKPAKHFPHIGIKASGTQICYSGITQMMANMSIAGGIFNATYVSNFFNYKDTSSGQYHQVWYDDPDTLTPRYQYARDNNLQGVGMWNADCLDYSDNPQSEKLTKAMWDAIATFVN